MKRSEFWAIITVLFIIATNTAHDAGIGTYSFLALIAGAMAFVRWLIEEFIEE